ncbi:putative inner membrane transporter YedA [Meiothermus luteus]|uniref:Putative inner membrane transporter YedA n=1 Tax=Meiothermus luteus TaxID=2026184 RepID=A0A399EP76_9DEIN|nr:EamA family transporter [Meiothermus luteus]RIH86427.1 putative inner membrane transporter YedA [Meiothermus luteus]
MKGKSLSRLGLLHLWVVYLVWSSTYLAFKVGVSNGFAPFWMGATRFIPAALLLLLYARWQGFEIRLGGAEAGRLALSGAMLWLGGNGLILVATQYVPSGYVALMIATTPIWAALLEGLLERRRPPRLLVAGLSVGLAGIGLLNAPQLSEGAPDHLLAFLLLILSPLMWASGTLYTQRKSPHLRPEVVSGYQQLFAGLGFLLLSWTLGEDWGAPNPIGWAANLYLIVFGSLVAYTSYILAVRLLPLSLVTTYAYVNPVIALLLGWLLLKEPVGLWTLAGSALVLVGVGLVFKSQSKTPSPSA